MNVDFSRLSGRPVDGGSILPDLVRQLIQAGPARPFALRAPFNKSAGSADKVYAALDPVVGQTVAQLAVKARLNLNITKHAVERLEKEKRIKRAGRKLIDGHWQNLLLKETLK